MIDCTILILTYKGKHHLEHLLPSLQSTIRQTKNFKLDVLIVDNGKDEATKKFVQENYPDFQLEWSSKNDYLFSLNQYINSLDSKFVCILNDDMRMHDEVLNQSLSIINADETLFSIGFKVLDWVGENITISVRNLEFSKGWAHSYFVPFKDDKVRYTLYAGGGAGVFRTSYFNQLKGFNTLYRPAYAEDLDIGHRAWHKGWPSIINPKAILYHREGGTIHEQFASDELEQKVRKNQLLWMVRNAKDLTFLFYFFVLLPLRFKRWGKNNRNLYLALKMAWPFFGRALRQRLAEGKPKFGDEAIMKKLNQVYEIRE